MTRYYAHDQEARRRRSFLRGLTARLAGVGLAVCSVTACFTTSEAEEQAMGASNAAEVDSVVPMVGDTAITRFVADLGRSLAATTSRAGLDWRFKVVDASEVNAFALPGGYVYVTRGLIEMVDSLDQLVGVMAHEIGHIVQRHSVEQLEEDARRDAGLVLLCTLTDVCSGPSGVGVQVGADALAARYSQSDEIEADSEAVVITYRAGFHPGGVPAFFQKMLEQRAEQPTLVDVIFSTHPTDQARVSRVSRQIKTLGTLPEATLVHDSPEFHAIQARSRALPPAPPQEEDL